MGQAKSRKQAIEALKRLGPRIDPVSNDPEPTAAMARRLHALLETAKRDGSVEPVVSFLYAKLNAAIDDFGAVPIACQKGCAHCCHVWVSASAPELFYIARIVRSRGAATIERLRAAHEFTKRFGLEERHQHPHPCAFLEQDVCSIYDSRPKACRLAVSGDAALCARVYRQLTNEKIPVPTLHLGARNIYAVAMAIALKRSQLPYGAYEFNAGLIRALDAPDAERAWLAGDDVFADVPRDPGDVFAADRSAAAIYRQAFG